MSWRTDGQNCLAYLPAFAPFPHLVGQMRSEVFRLRVVVEARETDVAMTKEHHVGYGAGNEEVRANVKLFPL